MVEQHCGQAAAGYCTVTDQSPQGSSNLSEYISRKVTENPTLIIAVTDKHRH
jgi:hypothetical protein